MYSSGMFARLAFAVAINVEPEILIVDEALSVGDMRFQIKCMDHMKKMMEGGTTVLFVSHDIGAVRRFCSSTIWINKGKIECYDETNAVCDRYMQFLKIGETDTELPNEVEIGAIPEFKEGNNIAEIVDFSVFDGRGNKVNSIKYDEYVNVIVTYDVYDENIVSPVLGVALYSIEDEYLCGLNTLLDKKTIPWKYGRNKYRIEYPQGLRAIGGKYYFTTALFEQTATVPIQFLSRIKEIEVFSGYVSEGKYIIPHKWSEFYE
jgi:lipopolysaccharide transport system ATP-binding protein/teichoic acid transport system ATP-binding protein